MSSDLDFDPNEKVVAHSVEHVPPRNRRVAFAEGAQARAVADASTPSNAAHAAVRSQAGTPQRKETTVAATATVHMAGDTDSSSHETVDTSRPASQRLPLTQNGPRTVTELHEDVWLPSKFVGYEWKDIQVRRFTVGEIRALVRARTSGNLRHLIRAVDGTLSRPVTDLTVGDFWYIMYWHRLNSYKKSPFIVEWTCKGHDHINWVEAGQRPAAEEGGEPTPIDAKSLRNLLTLNRSNIITQEIDEDRYNEIAERILNDFDVHVQPQALVDFVEAADTDDELSIKRKAAGKAKRDAAEKAAKAGDADALIRINDELANDDAEYFLEDDDRSFAYRYAALVSPVHGQTLAERAAWMDSQDPDLMVALEELLETSDHGVIESWEVKCKECGASTTVTQSLDALTFLPALQRGGLA